MFEIFENIKCELVEKEIEERRKWEQRRYEIAKDIYTSYFIGAHISGYSTTEAEVAKRAIHAADTLLEELKPKQTK